MKRKILAVLLLAVTLSPWMSACSSKEDKIQEEGDQQEAQMEQEEVEDQQESSQNEEEKNGQKVTVLWAGESLERSGEAETLKDILEEEGYQVRSYYADNQKEKQEEQLLETIEQEAEAVVVEPVAIRGMEEALQKAADAGISIISYRRLLMDTENVDAYAVYDYYAQGVQAGEKLEASVDMDAYSAEDPMSVEIFLGEEEINNRIFYMGLMEVLKPYLEEKTMVIGSGRDCFEESTMEEPTKEKAEQLCNEILQKYYRKNSLDLVFVSDDAVAQGICLALQADSYEIPDEEGEEPEESEGKTWPILIGGKLTRQSANRILTGKQTVAFDEKERELARACMRAVSHCISGKKDDTISSQYDNGVMIVDACLAETKTADIDNYHELLDVD